MDRIDKDEELVCPLCGGRLFWMPVSHIYACEHCKQSYSERNGVYMKKKRKSTAEKSSAVGNAAKLREALEQVQKKINYLIGNLTVSNSLVANRMEINGIINAALAAPPRNCDRFGTDNMEASLAYEEFCDRAEVEESVNGAIAWLLTLVAEKEGGNDGNK